MTIAEELQQLSTNGNLRTLQPMESEGKFIYRNGTKYLNLSGSDYMGIGCDIELRKRFINTLSPAHTLFGSTASRLLAGNHSIFEQLEKKLAHLYHRDRALLFNSGYHANLGILPAISNSNTLIIADKLVHASIIDGLRLTEGKYLRFRHNDTSHLRKLLESHAHHYERVIIVTESIYSMDGDTADLRTITTLKQEYPNLLIYVDEAHAIGAKGPTGLGICEELGIINKIDFIVGTFGKAAASMGAFVVCDEQMYSYLINKMRPLIFSTALPPITAEWSLFVMNHLTAMKEQRTHLQSISTKINHAIGRISDSYIIPIILGENSHAIGAAKLLEKEGYFVLPIRPPTVPVGTSRLRLSISSAITTEEADQLSHILSHLTTLPHP